MSKGKMWWIADDENELAAWKKQWAGKPIEIVKVEPHENSTMLDVVFELDRWQANELLGYAVSYDEWLIPEDFSDFKFDVMVWGKIVVRAKCESDAEDAVGPVVSAIVMTGDMLDKACNAISGEKGFLCTAIETGIEPDDSVYVFGADLAGTEQCAGDTGFADFTYDVKLFATVCIQAETEENARIACMRALKNLDVPECDIDDINNGNNNEAKVISVSIRAEDDEVLLVEVDGIEVT